jgi:hypothetical protein
MTAGQLKAWIADIPDDFEIDFQCDGWHLELASKITLPYEKFVIQNFIEGDLVASPEEEEDEDVA